MYLFSDSSRVCARVTDSCVLDSQRLMNFLPPIDLVAERKLIDSGTKNALDKLALHNLQEAVIYVRHCSRGSIGQEEIISLCWIALRQAAKNYCHHKSKGIRFFSFSKPYLRGQISVERKRKLVVRNSEHKALDETNDNALVETTVEPDYSNIESAELSACLIPAMFLVLNVRERAILILRYQSGFSFTEIGERIGFSRQSIQKVHAAALCKLRGALQEKKGQLI